MLTWFQVLSAYKQMIPQFGDFLGQLQAKDRQALEAHYTL